MAGFSPTFFRQRPPLDSFLADSVAAKSNRGSAKRKTIDEICATKQRWDPGMAAPRVSSLTPKEFGPTWEAYAKAFVLYQKGTFAEAAPRFRILSAVDERAWSLQHATKHLPSIPRNHGAESTNLRASEILPLEGAPPATLISLWRHRIAFPKKFAIVPSIQAISGER